MLCFWEDGDVNHSSRVHVEHDRTQVIQVQAVARRNTLRLVEFWRLYCSEYEDLKVIARGER